MDAPGTVGEIVAAMEERFGTKEVQALARESGISRTTILKWKAHPQSPPRAQSREHYRRIFGSATAPAADLSTLLAAVREVNENVELLRRELLAIRHQSDDRAHHVVTGRRPKHGGGGF